MIKNISDMTEDEILQAEHMRDFNEEKAEENDNE